MTEGRMEALTISSSLLLKKSVGIIIYKFISNNHFCTNVRGVLMFANISIRINPRTYREQILNL